MVCVKSSRFFENTNWQYAVAYNIVWSSLANRHSCWTSGETRDRKCFSMQLILVAATITAPISVGYLNNTYFETAAPRDFLFLGPVYK